MFAPAHTRSAFPRSIRFQDNRAAGGWNGTIVALRHRRRGAFVLRWSATIDPISFLIHRDRSGAVPELARMPCRRHGVTGRRLVPKGEIPRAQRGRHPSLRLAYYLACNCANHGPTIFTIVPSRHKASEGLGEREALHK